MVYIALSLPVLDALSPEVVDFCFVFLICSYVCMAINLMVSLTTFLLDLFCLYRRLARAYALML